MFASFFAGIGGGVGLFVAFAIGMQFLTWLETRKDDALDVRVNAVLNQILNRLSSEKWNEGIETSYNIVCSYIVRP